MKPKTVKTHSKKPPAYFVELAIGSTVESLPVIIRKHPKSGRMVIRYHPIHHHVALTLPRYVSIKQGLHFVSEKREWLAQQIQTIQKTIPFEDGQEIPVLGKKYILTHVGGRGVVRIEDDRIIVPGDAAFMARRVREWLKRIARETITTIASAKAKIIGKNIKRISLRDTSSRWGSCSHNGCLSFSWRLVFAPYEVLDYVTCHEVAHLKHHDHSPAFWIAVGQLFPDYNNSKQWLKVNGGKLYTYG
jgi:predicted metal-dependent hydrolase